MTLISDAIRLAYPDAVLAHAGPAFVRPAWTHDAREYSAGFYWQNDEGDRFYFDTFEEAADDIATDMGMGESEARRIVAESTAPDPWSDDATYSGEDWRQAVAMSETRSGYLDWVTAQLEGAESEGETVNA